MRAIIAHSECRMHFIIIIIIMCSVTLVPTNVRGGSGAVWVGGCKYESDVSVV